MTDMIPADAVREIIARYRDGASGRGGLILDDLKALLRPTMADDGRRWPTMAAMIAGMREEYAVQVRRSGRWQWSRDEDDFRWQDLAVQMVRTVRDHPDEETRLVRRYVTTPEEA